MNFVGKPVCKSLGLSGQKGGTVERDTTEKASIAVVRYQGGDPNYPTTIRPTQPTFGVRQEGQVFAPRRRPINKRGIRKQVTQGVDPQSKQPDPPSLKKPQSVPQTSPSEKTFNHNTYKYLKDYKRTYDEKAKFFTYLRNIAVERKVKPYENTFNIIREIDTIEKDSQSQNNYGEEYGLYADDVLSYLIEVGLSAEGKDTSISMERIDKVYTNLTNGLIKCTINGLIGTQKIKILLGTCNYLNKLLKSETEKNKIQTINLDKKKTVDLIFKD